MLVALLAVVISVVLGAVLGLVPGFGARALGTVRTFAFVAALGVIIVELLPDAFEGGKVLGLAAFGAGVFFPALIERAGKAAHGRSRLAHEAAYVGLLVHQVLEGVGLAAYASDVAGVPVAAALSAHTVPLAALVTLQGTRDGSQLHGALRAFGLLASGAIGVLLAGSNVTPLLRAHDAHGAVAGLVAGLLLHAIFHDFASDPPRTNRARTFETTAAFAALAVTLVGVFARAEFSAADAARDNEFARALFHVGLETAPTLLLGLVLGALVQTFDRLLPMAWLTRPGGKLALATRGAILGAPLPICACGILPVADALARRRVAPALVVAFLLATPEVGIDTVALTVQFFGWKFSAVRLVIALLISILGGYAVARMTRVDGEGPIDLSTLIGAGTSHVARFFHAFDELLLHTGPWILVGLLTAAYVEVEMPSAHDAAWTANGLDVVVVSALSIPSYVCATSATPLAAALLAKGVSPGAILAGLVLGPATNVATIGFLRRTFGTKATVVGTLAILFATWIFAFAVNAFAPNLAAVPGLASTGDGHDHGAFSMALGAVLIVLVTRSVWAVGPRAWVASLVDRGIGTKLSEAHAHDHGDHVHAHHHDAPAGLGHADHGQAGHADGPHRHGGSAHRDHHHEGHGHDTHAHDDEHDHHRHEKS